MVVNSNVREYHKNERSERHEKWASTWASKGLKESVYLKGLQRAVQVDVRMGPNEGESELTIKRWLKCLGQWDGREKGGTYFENEGLYLEEENDATTMVCGGARCNQKI